MNSITINVSLFEFIIFIICTVIAPIVNLFAITYIAYIHGAIDAIIYFILSSLIWGYGCITLINAKLEIVQPETVEQNQ
jgi:hypothetical protein